MTFFSNFSLSNSAQIHKWDNYRIYFQIGNSALIKSSVVVGVEFRIFGGEISFCFLCTYRHPQYECILSKEHAKKLRNMRKVFHFYDVISQVWTILYLMAISFMTESKTQWKYLRYVHMFFFYRFLGTTFQLHFIWLLRNRYFYQSMCFS